MPSRHPSLNTVRYPATIDDGPDVDPIRVSVPWKIINASTVELEGRPVAYPPIPNVLLVHADPGADVAIEIRADAFAKNTFHLSLHGHPPRVMSVTSPNSTSHAETFELLWHGVLAPAAVPGCIGVDWVDLCEILGRGGHGTIDWVEWDTEAEFVLPCCGNASEEVKAALAVVIAQKPPMATIKQLLASLRSALPPDVMLMPAAPFCKASQCGVILLQMRAGHLNSLQTPHPTLP